MGIAEHRKVAHMQAALAQNPSATAFTDFRLVHHCLPELALKEVDLSVNLFGFSWSAPVYINAMTGGHRDAERINEQLGAIAADFGVPVAVGSQSIALREPTAVDSFRAVRRRNPHGPVWANLGVARVIADVWRAVEMINADAIQMHLNAPQELAMPEGDRDFRGWLANLCSVTREAGVPVIAKEVGFGVSREDALLLKAAGVAAIDISGSGGTDFLAIERCRHEGTPPLSDLSWGIPTPISVIEALEAGTPILASGGVDTPIRAALCLALGARAVGLGRVLLTEIITNGEQGARDFMQRFIDDLRLIMCMQGTRNVSELQNRPVVISGTSRDWITARGLSPDSFGRR